MEKNRVEGNGLHSQCISANVNYSTNSRTQVLTQLFGTNITGRQPAYKTSLRAGRGACPLSV